MPLQATSGAASYDAFGGGVPVVPAYIEEVFSTYLWTGNGTSQTITNGIDLSGKGGMVWIKSRSDAYGHRIVDSQRTPFNTLNSASTSAEEATLLTAVSAFNSNGFTLANSAGVNGSGSTYASWAFRKQQKFFDIVTYTGTQVNRTISHNLGSVPACIIIKRTDAVDNWQVYHRSLANTEYLVLNSTAAKATGTNRWNSTSPTSTVFSLGDNSTVNESGSTYVAYLFAHNAGGFGLTGTDNVISCGSFTAAGGGATITLGYEPQWVVYKRTDAADDWKLTDNMRGIYAQTTADAPILYPNLSSAEATPDGLAPFASATGFYFNGVQNYPGSDGGTYIYIAIRRGPMKVPTSGTSVFTPFQGQSSGGFVAGFPVDMYIAGYKPGGEVGYPVVADRLRGANKTLSTSRTAAEGGGTMSSNFDNMTFVGPEGNESSKVAWIFKRAPSFFDVVCYTGNGSTQSITHNLTVLPELLIVKRRSGTATGWTALVTNISKYGYINETLRFFDAPPEINLFGDNVNYVPPTSTAFTIGINNGLNDSGSTYVAYLFATCAGVSKVGSYTGTATTLQVDCGFTGGARFVLIKRTDTTGGWYVWDTARGIVSGNDPYLLLNSTAAEVTNTDYVDTYSAGFEISSTAPAAINASGGSYIFLAIA